MQRLSLRSKAILLSLGLTVVLVGSTLYYRWSIERTSADVVESNAVLAETAVHRLATSMRPIIDSLWRNGFFTGREISRKDERGADSLLSSIAAQELRFYPGMEGGCFFLDLDQFFGYAFPTSPPPLPAFGPPPRSYNIIRDQLQKSISEGRTIRQLHQFDPATFPLVTSPLFAENHGIGGIWARVHIERLLPTVQLTTVLMIAAFVSLFAFSVVMSMVWRLRKKTEEIRLGLREMHTDDNFLFPENRGVFGEITHSINEMVSAQREEHHRRQELEGAVHQQDKMATLGKLIAGVAHEVKTPLAVIKTRIQMWQRKLRKTGDAQADDAVFSADSMSLVVREIDRLSELVRKLLVFSKPVTSRFAPCNVHELLQETIAVLQQPADDRHIAVQTMFDERVPQIALDAQAMEQVFLNVCMNALEAMDTDGTLRLSTTYHPTEQVAVIAIQDNGRGIPLAIAEKVFDPFFTTKEHGVGLGLSISYEIVRAHNGRIEFVRPETRGTACLITIPIQSPQGPNRKR